MQEVKNICKKVIDSSLFVVEREGKSQYNSIYWKSLPELHKRLRGMEMFLVFDVGGTYIKYAIMTREGKIVEKDKFPTTNQPGQGVDDFVNAIGGIYDTYCAKEDIEGIAIDLPGQVDVEQGIVYGGGGLPFLDQIPVAELISKRCGGIRVSLENDGKCAALSEIWLGNAKDCKNACVLVFGTGIAGGIVINRRIHHGQGMAAGEMSYLYESVTMEDLPKIHNLEATMRGEAPRDLPRCLWTMDGSVTAIRKRIAAEKEMNYHDVRGEDIYQWAEEGDRFVIDTLEHWYLDIAKHCCNMHVMLAPDIILLGGGVSAQPAFIEGVVRYAKLLAGMSDIYDTMRIGLCKFGNDSNLIGSLYNFMQIYEGAQ